MATPTDSINLAELGIASGKAWQSKYPNYLVDFTTSSEYLAFHEEMRSNILEQAKNDGIRREITAQLKAANKVINRHIKNVKDYLADEYGKEQAKVLYTGYGIRKINIAYSLPSDNDSRLQCLDVLVAELSKPNNLLANKKYGLQFWIEQRDALKQAWEASKLIDGTRSICANKLKEHKQKAREWQSRLRMHLRATFGASQYKSVWRDFGFQDEKQR